MRGGSDQFIIRDFEFYDSGVLAAFHPMLFNLYEVLRRNIWRSDTKGTPSQRVIMKENLLATLVSQSDLGEQLNISRQTVSKYLREMKRLGWLYTIEAGDYELAYVLGERVNASVGGAHEVFFADGWMRDIWKRLVNEVTEEWPEGTKVRDLPIARRIEVIESLADQTPSVSPALQEVSSQPDRGCKAGPTWGTDDPEVGTRDTSGISGTELAKHREDIEKDIENSSEDSASPRHSREPPSDQTKKIPPAPSLGSNKENVSAADRKAALEKLQAETSERQKAAREKKMRKRRTREAKQDNLKGVGAAKTPGITALEKVWYAEWAEAFPTLDAAKWSGKEFGQCKQLMEKYDAFLVKVAFEYIISCWPTVRDRVFKGRGTAPTLGTLLRLHDVFFPEAQKWVELRKAKDNYEHWFQKNPNNPYPPPELEKRYQDAQEGLKALGLD